MKPPRRQVRQGEILETDSNLARFQSWIFHFFQKVILMVPTFLEGSSGYERILAFLHVWRYILLARIPGDYLEFGVFEGLSFDLALRSASKYFKQKQTAPRFFAFDSFSGLPLPDPAHDSDFFREGAYSATQERFKNRICRAARKFEVLVIPGVFRETLTSELLAEHDLNAAAFINIDCDLYDSTITVLRFVTPLLQNGTVLYFDDWFFSKGAQTVGEAGACSTWLRENPQISLVDYGRVGTMGKLFLVNIASL